MVDQAEALRRLVLQRASHEVACERRGGLLVVVSARDGVGGTTVARQMALQLYRHAWNVGLVEVTHDGHSHAAWGRSPGEPMWQDVAVGRRTLREAWRPGPCGLPTVCSRSADTSGAMHGATRAASAMNGESERVGRPDPEEPAAHAKEWGAEQLQLAARGQWIVVDAGQRDSAAPFLEIADECCLVVDADPARTMEQYAEIKRLASHLRGARCWLLVNRTHDGEDGNAVRQRLIATAGRFLNLALLPLGELPEQSSLDSLEDARLPLAEGVADSDWRTAMRRIVQRWEDAQATPCTGSVRC